MEELLPLERMVPVIQEAWVCWVSAGTKSFRLLLLSLVKPSTQRPFPLGGACLLVEVLGSSIDLLVGKFIARIWCFLLLWHQSVQDLLFLVESHCWQSGGNVV